MTHNRGDNIKRIFIILTLSAVCLLCWKFSNWSKENQELSVVINEVCANSFVTAPKRWRENLDWIELYNASDKAISLKNWTMSDNEENIEMFTLPDIIIEPGTYQIIYASGEGYVDSNVYLNFRLSAGENLYLYNDKKEVVDCVTLPYIGQDTSYARVTDAGVDWANAIPTPEVTNNNMQLVQSVTVESPEFSISGGYYNGTQLLELYSETGLDIYYTLDGSEPDQNSIFYTEPILIENRTYEENVLSARTDISIEECYRYAPEVPVDKITVVRAIAVDEDGNKSEIITNSYVVDIQNNQTYQNLMTVSLATNSDYLFNKETGTYVLGRVFEEYAIENDYIMDKEHRPNYWGGGRFTEMPGCIEIFDADGNTVLNQNIGLRVRGNATRHLSQKSFGVFAREKYSGTSVFNTDVFGKGHEYHRLILMSDRDVPKVRHELHTELLKDRAVDTQQFIRCNVFLDGEYWGVYSIAEVFSEEYIANHYGIPEEEVVFYDGLWPEELVELCANPDGLSEEELYDALIEKIDLDSFIDYYASMLYIDNYDWLSYNGYVWKSATVSNTNSYQDGKWRWMVYDTEWSEEKYDRNTFQEAMVDTWETDPIVKVLMTSEEFRQQFSTVFMDLANTVFEKEHVLYKIDEVFAGYAHAMDAQGVRWGDDWADEVDLDLDKIREFFVNRFDYAAMYLKDELALNGELAEVYLENNDEAKGIIHINTVTPELRNQSWHGYYYVDYPIKLSITEIEENSFVGWYDNNQNLVSENVEITVDLSEKNYYCAVFK